MARWHRTPILAFTQAKHWYQRPWVNSIWDAVCLIAVCTVAVIIGYQQYTYMAATERWQARLTRIAPQPVQHNAPPLHPTTLAMMQQVHASLNTQWGPLYQGLEALSVQYPNVRLIRILPQASQHRLQLTVISPQFETLAPWMQGLASLPWVRQVSLSHHQWQADGNEEHVIADIQAEWQP